MRSSSKIILVFYILVGLSTIHLASLLDDPDHFFHPKQDCPLCQADKTLVIFEIDSNPFQTYFNKLYIQSIQYDPVYVYLTPTIDSIRAPPSLPALFVL
jgi:hypothetical protein